MGGRGEEQEARGERRGKRWGEMSKVGGGKATRTTLFSAARPA